MCSYNLVNGEYVCSNRTLLTTILRRQWGFRGFVTSDAASCHETAPDMAAGLNFDIADTCYDAPEVQAALADHTVSGLLLDQRVFEILRELFAFGFFDHLTWKKDSGLDRVKADERVADRAEEGGAVLLKNAGLLPITARRIHSIAVIGPAANQYIHGNGSSQVTPYLQTTALAGITARAHRDRIRVTYDSGSSPSSAEALARRSDLAVVVAADTESEGVDKSCLSLAPQCSQSQATPPDPQDTQAAFGNQDQLIADVAAANRHTVVVLETGAPVLTPWREQIGALLEAWYPGEDGGTAIARVLFGDVDPGGRLPATFPRHAGDIPTAHGGAAEYPGDVNPVSDCIVYTASVPCPYYQEHYSEGVMVGYRWYQHRHINPAYPFGFGLSYTSFHFSHLTMTRGPAKGHYLAHVTITNTGSRTGIAVPELYVSLPRSSHVPEPPWQLQGFAKLKLRPHRRARVAIALTSRSFSYWSDRANGWRIASGCDTIAVGPSSDSLPLRVVIPQHHANCRSGSR
jgi:beta-glucosidase